MSEIKESTPEEAVANKETSVSKKNSQSLLQYFKSFVKKDNIGFECILRGRIFLQLSAQTLGLLVLIIAMATPDIVIVSQQQGRIQTKLGFFIQCTIIRFRRNQDPVCEYGTLRELAAPVAMFFITFFSSFGALVIGLKFLFWKSDQNSSIENATKTFQQTKLLYLVAGLGTACGVITVTYLYQENTNPVLPGFVLLWIAAILHATSALIPLFIGSSLSGSSSRNAVAPDIEHGS